MTLWRCIWLEFDADNLVEVYMKLWRLCICASLALYAHDIEIVGPCHDMGTMELMLKWNGIHPKIWMSLATVARTAIVVDLGA